MFVPKCKVFSSYLQGYHNIFIRTEATTSNSDQHRAQIFVEKEDEINSYWTAEFGPEFIEKISTRFLRQFSIKELFPKLGKALTSGEKDVVIDWLTSEDLQSMAKDSSSSTAETLDDDRILVMVLSSSEFMAGIPFALNKVTSAHPFVNSSPLVSHLFRIIQRLKTQHSGTSKEEKNSMQNTPTVFLTGAESESSLTQKLKQSMEENQRLAKELRDYKQAPAVKGSDDKLKLEREIQALKNSLAEAEIEMSVIPALKKQLKDKIKEIEYLNLYAREVEICIKIRAPIPTFESYKAVLEKGTRPNVNGPVASDTKPAPRAVGMGRTAGPGFAGAGYTNTKRARTNAGGFNRGSERQMGSGQAYPTKELLSIYTRPGPNRTATGSSRTPSQSRSTSKSKREMPLLSKVTSTQKLPGYNIEYRNIEAKFGIGTGALGQKAKPRTRHY